ncbi:MAG TPA: hypothetical protein VN456_12515, partial [Desulfosporosinus sp.]|nr:hypothetical protein [Desulfosporosinus sp.]
MATGTLGRPWPAPAANKKDNTCEDSVCKKANTCEDSVFVGASQVFFIKNTAHPWCVPRLEHSFRVLAGWRLLRLKFWKIDTKFDGLTKIILKK